VAISSARMGINLETLTRVLADAWGPPSRSSADVAVSLAPVKYGIVGWRGFPCGSATSRKSVPVVAARAMSWATRYLASRHCVCLPYLRWSAPHLPSPSKSSTRTARQNQTPPAPTWRPRVLSHATIPLTRPPCVLDFHPRSHISAYASPSDPPSDPSATQLTSSRS